MATSGSVDYSESTNSLIKDALISIGAHDLGESSVQAELNSYGKRELNRMVKAWQARGYNLFRTTEGTITLVADQASYTMGGSGSPDVSYRPLRIHGVRYRNATGKDLPMTEMSRQEYFDLPDKAVTGTPTTYFYDPAATQGTLYIWPVPSTVTTETLRLTYERTFEDFDSTSDEPDFPQEWYDAIVKNLAAALSHALYPAQPQITAMRQQMAEAALQQALSFDRETASVHFNRDYSGR